MDVTEEVGRARRVADTLTSCHSVLRDRYAFRSTVLDVCILSSSACVVALSFIDPMVAEGLLVGRLPPGLVVGLVGLITFVLSLFQLRVDWKQRSERHGEAAKAYGAVKLELREALIQGNLSDLAGSRVLQKYYQIGERVLPIPDPQFNKLKLKHVRKMQISDMLSKHPGTSLWVIKVKMWLRDTKAVVQERQDSETS